MPEHRDVAVFVGSLRRESSTRLIADAIGAFANWIEVQPCRP